ncbi:MAG: alpha-amylase family protein [Armatimonadota bacterium]|nr:alpha-amylase family protein [Armatimonadota bacterium]
MTIGLLTSICAATHAQRVVPATEAYQPWLETACIMQPWSLERTRALVEDREEWIPRLKRWGFDSVIFIPGPSDIRPNYPMDALREAVDDYHAAGFKVIMYSSIMHAGHHETWHSVAANRPAWWQRGPRGGTVEVYGDKWLCPNTGALQFTTDLAIRLAAEMDADGIMLDNNEFYYTDHGATCYCQGCQESFGRHIRQKLGDERLREMGLDPERVRCPEPGEPLYPHWVDWRYVAWREATEEFRRRVREALPGTMLCANTQYKYNWVLAVHEQMAAEDVVLSESRHQYGREMSCKLAYGHALADGKPLWNYLGTWEDDDLSRILPPHEIHDQLCTTLAWGCSPWIVGYGLVDRAPAAHWSFGHYASEGRSGFRRHEEGGPDGSAAIELWAETTSRISTFQSPFLEVQPGQQFAFRCRYRTEGVAPGHPRLRLTFVNAALKPPGGEPYVFFAEGEGGTHGWEELVLDGVTAPEGAEVVNVEVFLWDASGSLFLDDVQFIREGENLLRNPGFERRVAEENAAGREALVGGLQFWREHEELYRGATRWADVGLLLSRHSVDFREVYNRFPRPTMNALLDAHIPFAVLEEHQLDDEHLSRFTVVVVPVASCLPEEGLRTLARWVRGGGRLIVTGGTGQYTQYGEERGRDLLAVLLGQLREALWEAREVGEGMARWLPQGDGDEEVAEGLVEAIRELGGGEIVRVEGAPEGIDLIAWAQADQRRLLLHLDRHEAGKGGDVALRLRVPEGWSPPASVTCYDLHAGEREVEARSEDGYVSFTVPAPEWYAVVAVRFGG